MINENITLTIEQSKALDVIKETILLNDELEEIRFSIMVRGGLSVYIKTIKEKKINFFLTKSGVVHTPYLIDRVGKI